MASFFIFVILFLSNLTGLSSKEALNSGCPIQYNYPAFSLYNHDHRVIGLVVGHAILVEKIDIRIDYCPNDVHLVDIPVKVEYEDEVDMLKKSQIVIEAGNTIQTQTTLLEIALPKPVYSRRLTVTFPDPVSCSQFELVGCETSEMCEGHEELCSNVGTCLGAGRCLCPKGTVGAKCDTAAENITLDSYEPIVQIGKTLYTASGKLDVSGDVKLDDTDGDRRRHFMFGGPSFNFFGGGGCMSFSQNNAGFTNSFNMGHPSSNSPCSAFATPWNGFSHSSDVMFGFGHDQSQSHYMFTTHSDYHHSSGSSMHFQNNMLHMHVHYPQTNPWLMNFNYDHHYHVAVPFFPQFGVPYNFGCSFNPWSGASMFVNGYMIGSQLNPTLSTFNQNFNPAPPALCMGQCGTKSPMTTVSPVQVNPRSSVNVSSANIVVAGADAPTLAQNSLLGILGYQMLNMLIEEPITPEWLQKLLNNSSTLTSTQKVTATTTGSITTTQGSVFTPAAAEVVVTANLYHVTATSGKPFYNNVNTTGIGVGPLCYDCAEHQPSDGTCANLTQCYLGQVCAVFEDINGYVHRCMDEQTCMRSEMTSSAQCWYCCAADLCNERCLSNGSFNMAAVAKQQTTTTTTQATTTEACLDNSKCDKLKAVGYDVCGDTTVADTMCKSSCKKCP